MCEDCGASSTTTPIAGGVYVIRAGAGRARTQVPGARASRRHSGRTSAIDSQCSLWLAQRTRHAVRMRRLRGHAATTLARRCEQFARWPGTSGLMCACSGFACCGRRSWRPPHQWDFNYRMTERSWTPWPGLARCSIVQATPGRACVVPRTDGSLDRQRRTLCLGLGHDVPRVELRMRDNGQACIQHGLGNQCVTRLRLSERGMHSVRSAAPRALVSATQAHRYVPGAIPARSGPCLGLKQWAPKASLRLQPHDCPGPVAYHVVLRARCRRQTYQRLICMLWLRKRDMHWACWRPPWSKGAVSPE